MPKSKVDEIRSKWEKYLELQSEINKIGKLTKSTTQHTFTLDIVNGKETLTIAANRRDIDLKISLDTDGIKELRNFLDDCYESSDNTSDDVNEEVKQKTKTKSKTK